MQLQSIFFAALSATTVSAHFSVTYPYWRGDSFATQWTYPCGGVNQSISDTNRTLWPLDGGAIVFKPTHDSAQTYVNLGLGNEVTRLNITLVSPFNQTGNGTFCFPKITIPEGLGIQDGLNASIQIIQLSHNGGALYNCADITFSSKAEATLAGDICFNSTGVGAAPFTYDGITSSDCPTAANSNATTTTTVGNNAAPALKMSTGAIFGAIGFLVATLMM